MMRSKLSAKVTQMEPLLLKRVILCFLILTSLISFSQEDIGIKTVVIDPGHGGKDPGAVGYSGVFEKDVALDVSLKLGKLIENNYSDVKVIYTRSTDEFVSLYERAKLANNKKADLFISIHANSASNRSAYGSETWVLGLHKSAAALEVAKRENASILMEENYEAKYQDFNPNNPDDYIGLTLRQSAFLDQSLSLAASVQHEFKNTISRYDRGVKQAGFLVLYQTTMPSILVELGFMSNQKEEAYLASEKGKNEMAESIYKAFRNYKESVENINKSVIGDKDNGNKDSGTVVDVKFGDKPDSTRGTDPEKTIYRVQIEMSSKKVDLVCDNFKGLENLYMYESNGFFKYTCGEFDTFDQANEYKKKARSVGYETAFVVTFKGDERIK